MGVTDLWSILEPVRESVPLYGLAGKTLAVDLSLWVCEAQSVKRMAGRVAKPHLRNLFFRVSALTLMGVKLIFVMEGEAPQMKAETMTKRTQLRFGSSQKPGPKPAKTCRSRFKSLLRECSEMLDYLGVPWVTAKGEAEAMCAFLDSSGSVDGCVTNDGDVFLYGGQTVYRNFNMNTKDPHVDCYRMERVRSELHLERETLVGLAVLLGCDYIPKGIPGVGKELTLKLIQSLNGQTLLQKFYRWSNEGQEVQEKYVRKVTHCHVCRHPGTAKTHEQRGCQLCGSSRFCEPQDYDYLCPCDWHRAELARQSGTVESVVKRKALASKGFPFSEVINEFLAPKDRRVENIRRRKPNLLLMQNFALEKMEWPKHYTSEKVLVLMTYTQMMNIKCGKDASSQIQPVRICKARVRDAIASFEILWKKPEHYLHADGHPDELGDVVTTIEEESLFRSAYPDMVECFLHEMEEAKQNKQRQKKRFDGRKGGKLEGSDDVSEAFALMSLCGSSEENTKSKYGKQRTSSSDGGPALGPAARLQPTDQREVPPEGHRELGVSQGATAKAASPPEPAMSPKMVATLSLSSPSASTIIDELHLSEIEWEACSFTGSPQPCQQGAALPTGVDDPVCSSGVRRPDLLPAVGGSDGSLRSRVLMKNATGNLKAEAKTVTPMQQIRCLPPLRGNGTSPATVNSTVGSPASRPTHRPPRHSSEVAGENASGSPLPGPLGTRVTARNAADRRPAASPKYRFVRTRENAGTGGRGNHREGKKQAVKKSVCDGSYSSSEDSNVENVPVVRKKTTVRGKPRQRGPRGADYQPDTQPVCKVTSQAAVKRISQCGESGLSAPSHRGGLRHGLTGDGYAVVGADHRVISQSLVSEACPSEGDDSVVSVDSPLPLAERLKRRLVR